MEDIKVGDLVRDKLNQSHHSYGLGIVLEVGEADAPGSSQKKKYDIYFTKFKKVLTFHGDYLERV
jgi:hypothetical protein